MVPSVFLNHGQGLAARDDEEPPPIQSFDAEELTKWSLYRAFVPEFLATFLFLAYQIQPDTKAGGDHCGVVGILGISWAFDGMIFILYTGSINIFINEVEAENKEGLLPDLILLLKRSMSTPDFDVGVTLDFNGGVTTSCLQSR
ncbi:hypothetical protein F2Q69_00009219 [Brassica cretica]|uniref:Uncharacterized protein n=1 Tax=Brassica cretica TaxID=69181 RepID=A0A8S9NW07_BRACR|nr:hypothetical protein F2Q69_00009219 [Brassica cretica]